MTEPIVLSTDHAPAHLRAACWGDLVLTSFGGLRSDTYGDDRFDGRSLFEQGGRTTTLDPGDWSVYDTTQPYIVSSPQAVDLFILLLPRHELIQGERRLLDLLVHQMSGRSGLGRIACETIRMAMQEAATTDAALLPDMGQAITHLVRLALLESAQAHVPIGSQAVLRQRILAHVEQHLRDPRLSIEGIAVALNCSKRSLHKALQGDGCTLHQLIWGRRLESACRELEDPRHARRSITEIAFEWGFSCSSHFSHAFKARYGVSPRDWRMGQRPAPAGVPALPRPMDTPLRQLGLLQAAAGVLLHQQHADGVVADVVLVVHLADDGLEAPAGYLIDDGGVLLEAVAVDGEEGAHGRVEDLGVVATRARRFGQADGVGRVAEGDEGVRIGALALGDHRRVVLGGERIAAVDHQLEARRAGDLARGEGYRHGPG